MATDPFELVLECCVRRVAAATELPLDQIQLIHSYSAPAADAPDGECRALFRTRTNGNQHIARSNSIPSLEAACDECIEDFGRILQIAREDRELARRRRRVRRKS